MIDRKAGRSYGANICYGILSTTNRLLLRSLSVIRFSKDYSVTEKTEHDDYEIYFLQIFYVWIIFF